MADSSGNQTPLKTIYFDVIEFGDVQIECAVSEDLRYWITGTGLNTAVDRHEKKSQKQGENGVAGLPAVLASPRLKPYLTNKIMEWTVSSVLKPGRNYGRGQCVAYPLLLLPAVCSVYVKAAMDGALTKQQMHVAKRCSLILECVSGAGIENIVAKRAGLNRTLEQDQETLNALVSAERFRYDTKIPQEFRDAFFDLYGVKKDPEHPTRCPPCMAQFTDECIHKRIGKPDVRDKVFVYTKKTTPRRKSGKLAYAKREHLSTRGFQEHQIQIGKTLMAYAIAKEGRDQACLSHFRLIMDRFNPVEGRAGVLPFDLIDEPTVPKQQSATG